jgi:hypothetical protein
VGQTANGRGLLITKSECPTAFQAPALYAASRNSRVDTSHRRGLTDRARDAEPAHGSQRAPEAGRARDCRLTIPSLYAVGHAASVATGGRREPPALAREGSSLARLGEVRRRLIGSADEPVPHLEARCGVYRGLEPRRSRSLHPLLRSVAPTMKRGEIRRIGIGIGIAGNR